MKNKEKYIDQICDFVCEEGGLAVRKDTGEVVKCDGLICRLCLFRKEHEDCLVVARRWLESEYIERLVISKRDRAFLDYLGGHAKWMTKDSDGEISVWMAKPKKSACMWTDGIYACLSMYNIYFPMVKWEDDEPWLIEDLKKLEVVENYE